MSKNWHLKEKIPAEISETLSAYEPLTRQLLFDRGLNVPEAAEEFLNPTYEKLHDPFLFLDMQKAVERIWQAINQKEKIYIYGDYDADAVTANAVLQQTFRHLGADVESYIPDRFTEGYGVNMEAVAKIKNAGAKVIITVDCGTNSTEAAEFCKKNNIDFIITDHHEIIGPTPQAYALINPKNPEDKYPYREITGVGVAFKLACGILARAKVLGLKAKSADGWEKWLLDLVAIGTVADCHSLLGENRILVKYGLKVLAKTKWIGLRALTELSGLDFAQKPPDAYTLGFIIAPRLNAAGRLEHADAALHLLTETNAGLAAERAQKLNEINRRRQDITARLVSEAREQAIIFRDRKVLVLLGENWPKGVVGLVAGRLAEEFRKPVIVLDKGETESTGSARTAGEFNVVEALKHASAHLVRFGGHQQAAGLTLKTADYEPFYQKILEYADRNLSDENTARHLHLDGELDESQLSIVTCQMLSEFEPFGVDNHKPKFLIPRLHLSAMRAVGAEQKHIQFQFRAGPKSISGIGFNLSALAQNFQVGDTVDAAAELMLDGWNGRSEVKLRVVDMRKI